MVQNKNKNTHLVKNLYFTEELQNSLQNSLQSLKLISKVPCPLMGAKDSPVSAEFRNLVYPRYENQAERPPLKKKKIKPEFLCGSLLPPSVH